MMNYKKKTILDADLLGKKVLCRCDFNVPTNDEGVITDDSRIVKTLPTIRYLLENGAAVIACSHLGRPKGQVKPEYSLAPVAERLSALLGLPVKMAKDVVGEDAKALAAALMPGEVMLLENLRFHAEEEKNDPAFAAQLAAMADLYVSDAFGTVHRAHASTEGVAHFLPAVGGFLVEKELQALGRALDDPRRPLVAITGGSKVSDKLVLLAHLIDLADTILIGGGMIALAIIAVALVAGAFAFDGLFTGIHQLLFADGTWTFSSTSAFICALPTEFWTAMGALLLAVAAIFAVICIVIGKLVKNYKV